MTVQDIRPVGQYLRDWRQKRRLSQLDLACEAEISARHLSFLETGRSQPSREMILRLAEQLKIPMRERNVLLVAGGYAPIFSERPLDDPALAPARDAIQLMLESQKPYPAFAVDRHWTVVMSNRALPEMYEGVAPELLEPPVNGMRLSLHPKGVAQHVVNLAEWRAHLLHRLSEQVDLTADPALVELQRELLSYPAPEPTRTQAVNGVAVPFKVRVAGRVLSFLSTTMIFGTPLDITLSELALEAFFAADAETAAAMVELSRGALRV